MIVKDSTTNQVQVHNDFKTQNKKNKNLFKD